jgi:hypothetical protein
VVNAKVRRIARAAGKLRDPGLGKCATSVAIESIADLKSREDLDLNTSGNPRAVRHDVHLCGANAWAQPMP